MNWESYFPPNVRLTRPVSKPIIATFTFVSDVDILDEDLIEKHDRLQDKYDKVRKIITNVSSESCADVAKKVVFRSISFLEKIRKQVAESNQNVDLVFRFGNGSTSNVHIRHEDCSALEQSDLCTAEMSICLKVIRHGRSCVLEPSDIFYQHCRLACENKQEFYVYPSYKICDASYNYIDKKGADETNLFITLVDNRISRVYARKNDKSQSKTKKSSVNKKSLNQSMPLRRSKRNIVRSDENSPQEDKVVGGISEMDKKHDSIAKSDESHSESSTDRDEKSISKSPVRMAMKTPQAKNTMNDKNNTNQVLTPFILFCNEKRAEIRRENPNIKATHLMKKLGKLWRDAGSELRAKYTDQSKRVSAEESEKIDVYRRMKTTDVQNGYELKPVSSRKRKNSTIAVVNDAAKDATTKKMIDSKKSKTDPDKPKRPPSAFMLFSHAFRKKNKGIAPNKIFKMIAEAWKDVSVDEKKSYDAEAKIEKEKWKKAMEKYQINSRIKG